MENQIELYAKEKSLLQLPLFFFGKERLEKTYIQWSDGENKFSLECVCKYGVPGSFEQDVYTATMRIWLKQGMSLHGIKLNYSDICRELHLLPPKYYVGQVKKALKKLAQARYEFKQCFLLIVEGHPKKIDTHFSLYDSASLFSYNKNNNQSKRQSESHLIFPDDIRQNLEAKYYQYLDMVWYRSLPEGLPRRLYEYLEKRKYHSVNDVFLIGEEAICRWLPITDTHSSRRKSTIAHTAQALIDVGYLLKYEFDKCKKICHFTYGKKEQTFPAKDTPTVVLEALANIAKADNIGQPTAGQEVVTGENHKKYLEALAWLDTIPYFHKSRKREIAALPINQVVASYTAIKTEYEKKELAGKTPKAGWVFKAFMDQWDFTEKPKTRRQLREEKKELALVQSFEALPQKVQQQLRGAFEKEYQEFPEILQCQGIWLKYIETNLPNLAPAATTPEPAQKQPGQDQAKAELGQLEAERSMFLPMLADLDRQIKLRLWQQADSSIVPDAFRRDSMVKINYLALLLDHFKRNGVVFSQALAGDFRLAANYLECPI